MAVQSKELKLREGAQKVEDELAACEVIIEKGLQVFMDVGNALMKIRRERLYRIRYRNFGQYCRDRWQLTASYANRLIMASEIAQELEGTEIVPTSESQIRPLAAVKEEERRAIWKRAVEISDGKPTQNSVHRAIQEKYPGTRYDEHWYRAKKSDLIHAMRLLQQAIDSEWGSEEWRDEVENFLSEMAVANR